MRKLSIISLLTCIIGISICFSQEVAQENDLRQKVTQATSDTAKVAALQNLAYYYYFINQSGKGDSTLEVQLNEAELSGNNNLVLKSYFDNNLSNIPAWSTAAHFDKTLRFIDRGIEYAKKVNDRKYTAIGYIKRAALLRKMQKFEDAVAAATTALTTLQDESDSLKAAVYIELGDSYRAKKEAVLACRNYNNAYDISLKEKNIHLQTRVFRSLSLLYRNLDDSIEAKDFLLKSVELNRKHGYRQNLIRDYLELAGLTDKPYYIGLAISLADSLGRPSDKLRAKEILLAIYLAAQKDSEKALSYLHSQPDLLEYYKKDGIEGYFYELGVIYRYGSKPDSGLHYLKIAEPALLPKYTDNQTRSLYVDIAACHSMKNNTAEAISYYQKALQLSQQLGDYSYVAEISDSLGGLYKKTGDLRNAILYMDLSVDTKDGLAKSARDKDLIRLSVDRERSEHENDLKQKQLSLRKKRDLQYMSITIAICLVFVLTLILGMFPISKLTIKILGYFFFISVFEFIVLVLDNDVLHGITHGEPLKLWLIKIALIGSLVPVQHWLEHKLIHFLESRKLLKARTSFSFKKWLPKRKPIVIAQPAVAVEEKQNEPAA